MCKAAGNQCVIRADLFVADVVSWRMFVPGLWLEEMYASIRLMPHVYASESYLPSTKLDISVSRP